MYAAYNSSMSMLVTSEPWGHIHGLVSRHPARCHVAVAYFGAGASKLLPLKKGSVLIVDMSERAVGSGQTKPLEVLRLINEGVEVHSVANLHAKVFVIGAHALVGSTNVSYSSAKTLIEAVLETEDRAIVKECRQFVRSLKGEFVSKGYARRMQQLYRPPRFASGGGKRKRMRSIEPVHSPLWIVPLERISPDQHQLEHADVGRPQARKLLRFPRRSVVDEFFWDGFDLLGRLAVNDIVIQVTNETDRRMVSTQGRVLHIERYREGQIRRGVVFLEIPKRLRRKNLNAIIARLGLDAKFLLKLWHPRILRDPALAHSLLNFWSNGHG